VTPVAVTGAAALTPLGSPPELWARCRTHGAAALSGREAEIPLEGLSAKIRTRAQRVERIVRLALVAAGMALASAGLTEGEGDPRPRLGVVLGTALGCFLTNAEYQRRFAEGWVPGASPRLFAATVSNAAAGEIGIAYRLGGPSVTLTAGAASGLAALSHAADVLGRGRADALVAGGVDAVGEVVEQWTRAGGLDIGLPVTEAAAVVVLETLVSATRRGAPVVGTIDGSAVGFEPPGGGPGAGDGLAGAVVRALSAGGIAPADVSLVVSGASPPLRNLQAAALHRALGESLPRFVAPKDVLGETLGAAGPLGLLAALAEAPRGAVVLVLDLCPSGHVAALVARAGAPA